MTVPRAVVTAATYTVACPQCNAPLSEPRHGSHQWALDQVRAHRGILTCPDCGLAFRLVPPR